jgi:hypothetical protein
MVWRWWPSADKSGERVQEDKRRRRQLSWQRRSGTSPYSDQYETIVGRGHTRPTATFGAPTLIWHVAVWPRSTLGGVKDGQPCDPHDTADKEHDDALRLFADRRHAWISEIDETLCGLETCGRLRRGKPSAGRAKRFAVPGSRKPIDAGAVGMELWWHDPADAQGDSHADDIRVRLQVDLTADYVSYCFYMDIGRTWDGRPGAGRRRSELLAAVESVQRICRADRAASPDDLVPPDDLDPNEDGELLRARNLLYVRIWEEFTREMNFSLQSLAGERGEVFANFRGLVMPAAAWPGGASAPLAKFSGDPKFDADGPEANAVIKAHWPLARRITPAADYREFIACGVMNWRALYITALGASSQHDPDEGRPNAISDKSEADVGVRQDEVAGNADSTLDDDGSVWKRRGRDGHNHPVRYLLLTKGQPNHRQIGRIVERINAMGTMRLFALKDLEAIRSADGPIRMLGQELDMITGEWSSKRQQVEGLTSFWKLDSARYSPDYSDIQEDLKYVSTPGPVGQFVRFVGRVVYFIVMPGRAKRVFHEEQNNRVLDAKYQLLYRISSRIEGKLIKLGARLDRLGREAVGGPHFRINRSRHYVREFRVLLKTLNVGNVPTWVSYDQFVMRGLQPAFDEISDTGRRLRALRARLGTVTEMIETSALVGQSAATRHNTAVLRSATAILLSIVGVVVLRLTFPKVWEAIANWLRGPISQIDSDVSKQVIEILNRLGPWALVWGVLGLAALSLMYALYRRLVYWLRS